MIASGRVQGVGFRATVRHLAERIGVAGTARNLPDGNVEIIVQGTSKHIEAFVKAVQEESWPARVESLDKQPLTFDESMSGFRIVH
jgi:acylphosphatase